MIVDSNILSTYNLVLILNVKVLALYSDAYMVLARIVLAVSLLIVLITVVGCCGIRLLYIVCNLYVCRRLSKMDRIFKRRDRTMKPVTSSSLTLSKERKIYILYYGYLNYPLLLFVLFLSRESHGLMFVYAAFCGIVVLFQLSGKKFIFRFIYKWVLL